MSKSLYDVFQEHLFSDEINDDISPEDFAEKVVTDYINQMIRTGHILTDKQEIEVELKEEVISMTRKKTYGHFSLTSYRKSKIAK